MKPYVCIYYICQQYKGLSIFKVLQFNYLQAQLYKGDGTHSQKAQGTILGQDLLCGLLLPVSVWFPSGYSSFFPQSKDIHGGLIRFIGDSKHIHQKRALVGDN